MIGNRTKRRSASLLASVTACFLFISPAISADENEMKGPDPEQIARGANAWAEVCNRCHNLRDPVEITDEDWIVSVTHMRVRANLPGQLARDIEAFLKASN